ncbi:MAG TPA: extracellular solute-binding protein [Sphaerochaeta sp.]|nr:extracellular solute-binding protein [Sphaerochaeta sp.]HQB90099.1 extracellular solute-binding protein [Sphaerochaeta sp.]
MKKKTRGIFVVLLVLLMTTSLFAQGQKAIQSPISEDNLLREGTQIVKEKITLTGFGSKYAGNAEWDDDMLVWRELEKRTNIRVEWETVVNTEARTKAQTLIAANDLPDIFFKNALNMSDVRKFSESGQLIDLKQFMDEGLMPNFTKAYNNDVNLQIALTEPDGRIFTLPAYYPDPIDTTRRFMYINEKWLERVGMDKPTTMEEFYDVARAFRDMDANGNGNPSDEYPVSFGNITELDRTTRGFSGIDNVFSQPLNIIDGELYQMYTSENMRESFRILHTLYSEKLIELDIFTRGTSEHFARLSNDQIGISLLLPPADSSQFGILEPTFGPLGSDTVIWNWKVSPLLGVACFSITSANKYPRETARWIDYFFGEEGATLVRMGVEGDTYRVNADGSMSYTEKITEDPQGAEFAMANYTMWLGPNNMPGMYTAKQTLPIFEGTLTPDCVDIFAPYNTEHAYSLPTLPTELEKERATLIGEVNKYFNEARAAFMTGKLDLDKDWDKYVSDLKKLQVDRVEEIYREAFKIIKSKF